MISKITAIFFATLAVSVLFNTPKRQMLLCGMTGGIGWFFYEIALLLSKDSIIFATFIATVSVTICSRILGVIRKTPITVFLVAGIIPFVPGAGVYYTMYYAISISENNFLYMHKGIETLRIAGTIAVAIMIVLSIPIQSDGLKSRQS